MVVSPILIVYSNLRKVNILLQALDRLGNDVEYYAVDLSLPELKRTFSEIPTEGYKHVKCFGLHGTYDHALEWLKSSHISAKPKTILWLGSSVGNFKRDEVPPFLVGFRDALQPGNTMLIGIDSCKDPNRVFHAYNDRENVTRQFTLNGLKHANHIMKKDVFNLDDWEAIGEYDVDAGCHHAFVAPLKDVVIDGIPIPKGERIRIEESYKYSQEEIRKLWQVAQLTENTVYTNSRGDYGLHFVSKPLFYFPLEPEQYAPDPVPSLSEWRLLWDAWDQVTRNMIPEESLLSQPIKLRNVFLFYLGHIPTFLDIHISRATGNGPTKPAYFRRIFERGIDPDVENPELCHDHSEIPEEWPPLQDVLSFQLRVRKRTETLYASLVAETDARVSRGLWLAFEHEAMHLETLLYMLVQSENVLPPRGTLSPDYEALARQSSALAVPNEWFTIPESDIELGLDDSEDRPNSRRYFGWDNEKPRRSAHVKSFRAKARPITNREYADYLEKTGNTAIPASWCDSPYSTSKRDSVINGVSSATNGLSHSLMKGKYIRTVYGTVPLEYALDWPVVASYNELAGCAQWMGGRIPTLEEARSIYAYVDRSRPKCVEGALHTTIPAVNG